ncbi:MAG TPA: nucleotidyltransferase domain-containing protein [Acidobacteriota bacterium]|jgi:predicted nucleotidyltransferase|nr:nucleotidyltransferase domain-containing protein [Acidobacteriota bacterium]
MKTDRFSLQQLRETLTLVLAPKPVHQVILFGSRARGEDDAYSDTDLVLVADTDRPFVERFKDFWELFEKIPPPIQLLVYTPQEFRRLQDEENPFLQDVLTHGLIVYEKRT